MTDLNQHRLKFSIDIHSIKEHSFRGLIYAHYSHYPGLGIKQQFRTTPVLEVTKPFVEIAFSNSFACYIFEANKEQLQQIFEETDLIVDIFHQDRLKKDQLIGTTNIKLSELLKSPIRKSAKSYARALDAYYPIDEVVEDDVKRIGLLRCICYLEDLGPLDQLKLQEQQTIEQISDPALPIINYPSSDNPEKQQVIMELHSLEHKVIWELDTWKKSEEAKFRVLLKQKEYDLTQKLYSDFKQKEVERERQFKQSMAALQVIENKIKSKGNELIKREQRIIQMEEEVKQKLLETAKIIKQKDEEMGFLVKKQKDEKLSFEKEKTLLNLKLTDVQGMITKFEEENKNLKKEMDKSPVAMVKTTLQEKTQELNDLKKELERTNSIKEQYKQYYEKMRDELIRQKQLVEENTFMQQQNTNSELERLRNELQEMKVKQYQLLNQQNTQQIKQFTNELEQQEQMPSQPSQPNIQNQVSKVTSAIPQTVKKQYKEYPNQNIQSDLQRLLQEREYLIDSGEYEENDPLIIELSKQIQELGGD